MHRRMSMSELAASS